MTTPEKEQAESPESTVVNKTPHGVVDRDDDFMDERYGTE